MIRLSALFCIALAVFTNTSCDSHSWEKTQVLHEKYGAHGSSEHGSDKKDAGHTAPAHETKDAGHAAPAAPKAAH